MTPEATIVITTRNRRDDLRVSLTSALKQDLPLEILVIDDGSTDGTADMVRAEFPSVRVERSDKPLGLIVQRNRAAEMASTNFIVSIDDDAEFTSPSIVSTALKAFSDPRIAAVGIPFIDVKLNSNLQQHSPEPNGVYISHWYIGTAHVLRRDVFRKLGGYRGFFFVQQEEREYSMRMFREGYFVRVITCDPIHHYLSPKRPRGLNMMYSARNQCLICWLLIPATRLPVEFARVIWQQLRIGFRRGLFLWAAWGAIRGGLEAMRYLPFRKSMTRKQFSEYHRITRMGSVPLDELLRRLA